ncbi:hypothetical protein AYK26_04785 [Euryarchaeota archaeon SM23-78]|nr:MAG: hypothetical protein AYK26_04785 [Euryarchaeota archaeon SM23-78]
MATMNTAREVKQKNLTRKGAELSRSKLIRFTCMPGVRPVIMPKRMPANKAIKISVIILCGAGGTLQARGLTYLFSKISDFWNTKNSKNF